jgi:type II secretory ATPase GspE/PulE/Tfp pilus assembly ATPase PilB-like protein
MTAPIASAVDSVQRLLERACEMGASDLHIEPDATSVTVRARRDGVLVPLESLPAELGPRLVGRLKALADLLAYRTDVPQEGRIPADRSGVGAEIRVSTYPTLFGERAALRFDAPDASATTLEALGLPAAALAGLRAAVERPDGVVLLTGPSGSGKTTTLYACLRHVAARVPRRSIVTVEDPVERRVPGVTQTQVAPAAGLDFARALRSLLRQDPEVLLVGEIRDRETAAIALEAGLTGHLVASTIHAGTAPQVFARLLDMGAEPFVATTAVRGVLAQRLLRRRCSACAASPGCAECGGTGLRGRVLVAEWLEVTPPVRAAILARADGDAIAAAAKESGFRSLRDEAVALADAGITTSEEVDRVLGPA